MRATPAGTSTPGAARTATAPRRTASATNRRPSSRCPGSAAKRKPGDLPIAVPGLPLGAFEAATYDEQTLALAPGDVIVFHTDGVSEARAGDEDYGLARLRRQVEQHAALSAEEMGDRILADLSAFASGNPRRDDLTLLIVKIR